MYRIIFRAHINPLLHALACLPHKSASVSQNTISEWYSSKRKRVREKKKDSKLFYFIHWLSYALDLLLQLEGTRLSLVCTFTIYQYILQRCIAKDITSWLACCYAWYTRCMTKSIDLVHVDDHLDRHHRLLFYIFARMILRGIGNVFSIETTQWYPNTKNCRLKFLCVVIII